MSSEIPPELCNIHLIRQLVEEKWKLERPDVIITITGGAQAFDLSTTYKDVIMKGAVHEPISLGFRYLHL